MPVCVTGMHRSGTSMLAHLLSACGVDLGPVDELLPADHWNADGYWENRRFVGLSEEAFDLVGAGWDNPPAEAAVVGHADVDELRQRVRRLVAEVGLREPWAWKDPRASLLSDFWLSALPGTRFVLCVRNPLEVALSLQRRSATSPSLALSLWTTYNRRALAAVPPGERVVATYESFFEDAAGALRRILVGIGVDVPDAAVAAAAAHVKPALRHHLVTDEELRRAGVPEPTIELYGALREEAGAAPAPAAVAVAPPTPDRPRLHAAVTDLQERDRRLGEVSGLRADRDNWQAQAERLQAESARWRDELAAADAELASAEADRAQLRNEVELLAADRERWRDEAAQLALDRDNWRREHDNWRREAERMIDLRTRRTSYRLSRLAFRLARSAWWALPARLRDGLRPLIFPSAGAPPTGVAATPAPVPRDAGAAAARPRRRRPASVAQRVSVVLPTKNAGPEFARVLDTLARQDGVPELELVVADSGSSDGTAERAAAAGATVVAVDPAEFGHGRTRNLAAERARGDVLLMFVQDAFLLGRTAVRDLVLELCEGERIAAVSARQVPRSGADLYGAFVVVSHYRSLWGEGADGNGSRVVTRRTAAAVDNVCAAIRREAWEELAFADVQFAEDLDFGLRAVDAGWEIRLSHDAAVSHSHDRDSVYHLRRSVADRLHVSPRVGDESRALSAAAGPDAVLAAAAALVPELQGAAALARTDDAQPLSGRIARLVELLEVGAPRLEPGGELATLAAFCSIGRREAPDRVVSQLRRDVLGLLRWAPLDRFTRAYIGVDDVAFESFVAKLAGAAVGRAVGDALRSESAADAAAFLAGV